MKICKMWEVSQRLPLTVSKQVPRQSLMGLGLGWDWDWVGIGIGLGLGRGLESFWGGEGERERGIWGKWAQQEAKENGQGTSLPT